MNERIKLQSFTVIFIICSYSLIIGILADNSESKLINDRISSKSNLSNYEYNTFNDDFTTPNTGYDPSLWHSFQRGDGDIINNIGSITFDSENGGYQLLKSKRIFDTESAATVALKANVVSEGDFLYFGWASSLPGQADTFNWSPENSKNAIYIKNSNFLGRFELDVINDYSLILSSSFEVDFTETTSVFLSWSSVGVEVRVDGEEVLFFGNANYVIPMVKMHYYIGIKSGGWPDRNNYFEIAGIILQAPTLSSDMPMFIELNNGYLFVEGDTDMILSWVVDDDDPHNFTIWLEDVIMVAGTWVSNEPITYALENLILGVYNLGIQVWDQVGNSLINWVSVKIVDPLYFINNDYIEDFDTPSLNDDWVFHEVQSSTVELQNGVLKFQGGGVAAYEYMVSRAIGTSMLINIAMLEPVTHGGSGFGWSDYDYLDNSFTEGSTVFSPFIQNDASNAIFISNSGDGSHFRMYIKTTSDIDPFDIIQYNYDFYLENRQFQDFILIWNTDGIELYASNILIQSFFVIDYNLPKNNLYFSSYSTSWGKESLTEINSYQIQLDSTNLMQNGISLYNPMENTVSFLLPSNNIIDIIEVTPEASVTIDPDTSTIRKTVTEKLAIDIKSLYIGGIVIFSLITVLVLNYKKRNLNFSGISKDTETLIDEPSMVESNEFPDVVSFLGVCGTCGTVPKQGDLFCGNCGSYFK